MLDGIDVSGFSGGFALEDLHRNRCQPLPREPGVYLVVRATSEPPAFLDESPAGWFKGRDPSYPRDLLLASWVPDARVVYAGKAAGASGIRQRVRQLVDFGFGKPVGHRGGRALWHLRDHGQLRLHYRSCPREEADDLESVLIEQFRVRYGVRPFANKAK